MSYDNLTFNTQPVAAAKGIASSLLSPWRALDRVFHKVVGYSAGDFEFVYDRTPFSTYSGAGGMVALYLLVVFGGREVMRDRKPLELNTLFKLHNLFLSLLSGSLLVLFIQQLAPSIWRKGLYDNICGASGWTQPLVLLYYINYLTKYYELIDTVFLMLRKKPLTFLHCYHHPATALLCFTQLLGYTPISWVPITLNLTVHVVMYWYYFQAARGVKVWWKQWITRLQIAQFVLDLGFVYFACYDYWAGTYATWLPHMGQCAGELVAAISGGVILSSYLVLFVMFYITTYKKAGRKAASPKIKVAPAEKSEKAAETQGN
ncbi:putative elongation of fatty acids protein 1 [Colletotrichum orbiculare MAFF 240422]|uniref:Elongation of fatty acids protein n=1 Tax=Colletotrichum orbiculare (strain 104-T / ATCC 96160 / CBS 514.97 / LARS 414 / MAFF 240422) TaxID=1213857 RepID=N4VP93_COLOR|nr:putative elongation of fatty acids protein 1 [Colletotrichum orbiculare MAFF 240422]